MYQFYKFPKIKDICYIEWNFLIKFFHMTEEKCLELNHNYWSKSAFLGLQLPDIGNFWRYGLSRFKVFLAATQTMVNFPATCSLNTDFFCPVPIFFHVCPYLPRLNKPIITCFPEKRSLSLCLFIFRDPGRDNWISIM